MKIKSIKKCESEKVYDITVKDEAHYILENGVVSHNSGLYYAATNIIFLSKRKEKVGTEVIGNIIHCKNQKSRLTIEIK
jgi:DNA polymerase III epsilon subunit-like protein